MAIKEYNVNFSDGRDNFVSILNSTGLFTNVTDDKTANTISAYSGESKILDVHITSSSTAQITFFSDFSSGIIGANDGFADVCVAKAIVTAKGFMLGYEENYNMFFGRTASIDGDTGIGCVYCGSTDVNEGKKYKSCGKTSLNISSSLTVPAQDSDFTVLTNAYSTSGTEYFDDIYFTSAREDGTIMGRIAIGGHTGYTNGRIVLMDT